MEFRFSSRNYRIKHFQPMWISPEGKVTRRSDPWTWLIHWKRLVYKLPIIYNFGCLFELEKILFFVSYSVQLVREHRLSFQWVAMVDNLYTILADQNLVIVNNSNREFFISCLICSTYSFFKKLVNDSIPRRM